jgi:hypothetical protein
MGGANVKQIDRAARDAPARRGSTPACRRLAVGRHLTVMQGQRGRPLRPAKDPGTRPRRHTMWEIWRVRIAYAARIVEALRVMHSTRGPRPNSPLFDLLRVAVPLAVAAACSNRCELTPTLQEIAGEGAIACGSVPLRADATAVNACAVAALRANRPFWFSIQLQGIDSEVWSGIARGPDGVGYSHLFDGGLFGGSRSAARIQQVRCGALAPATVDGREQVQCMGGGALTTLCGR